MGSFRFKNDSRINFLAGEMSNYRSIAFIFPGQGAQYPGMGKDFYQTFPEAKLTFEEADDLLKRKISTIILEGPEDLLTQTRNSQVGIYIMSIAVLRSMQKLLPHLVPSYCAGFSLGEYSAATAAGCISFNEGLQIVQQRGLYMNDACEAVKGTMAAVIGLDADTIEQMVKEVNLPNDLWAANFNCPGQVVISGTMRGIEAGAEAAKARGAKRVLPLAVHGGFHSGLMAMAEDLLAPHVEGLPLKKGSAQLVMNVTGRSSTSIEETKKNLILQVTHPVRWEHSMRYIAEQGADLFIELGCGKTLAGFHKRIGVTAPIISVEKVEDLKNLEQAMQG